MNDVPFHNPCGGVGWREQDLISVDGMSDAEVVAQGPFAQQVEQSWQNFQPEIIDAARSRKVPPQWILGILATETGILSASREKQAANSVPCGASRCVGPMAVMESNASIGGYTPSQLADPAINIDTGAAIMRYWMDKGYDLPAIAAGYNAGSVCCPDAPASAPPGRRVRNEFLLCSAAISGEPYPLWAIRASNYAVMKGFVTAPSRLAAPGPMSLGTVLLTAGLVIGGGFWVSSQRRRR